MLAVVVALAATARTEAYPFLAIIHPVDADLLIVEGWIPDEIVSQAAAEFKRGHYRQLLVVRSVYDTGEQFRYESGMITCERTSRLLIKYGVLREALGTLYYPATERDRTYHAALAARDWLAGAGTPIKPFNVVTEGPHARRSWLMFSEAFGNTVNIGVVALTDPRYDPNHWWHTSEGVRDVLGEAIAYSYARFFLRAVV
jgi:uncharacterized SAM-binding protein YcdF (DUF218 family)